MKNRFFWTVLALFLSYTAAFAGEKVHVTAVSEFSTANPAKTIDVEVIGSASLGENQLNELDIIHCNVAKIYSPKRGKRAASFAVIPVSYTSDGVTKNLSGNFYGKYSANVISKETIKNADKAKVGKKAVLSVGNHFIKGVAPVAALAEGMIKNEDGNRIQSGVKQVYKSSPISYVEKGKELDIKPGDSFYLVFKPVTKSNPQEIEQEIEADEASEE